MPCEFGRDIKDTEKKHTSSFGDLQEFFHSIFTVLLIFIHSLCVIVTRSKLLLWIELREQRVMKSLEGILLAYHTLLCYLECIFYCIFCLLFRRCYSGLHVTFFLFYH